MTTKEVVYFGKALGSMDLCVKKETKTQEKKSMNKAVKSTFAAMVSFATICATAFEYNVTRPALRPRWSGAEVGEWTMDRETAFSKAKADSAYTIVLFTGSWWCPICQTCEAKVLTSQAWADYVANVGYYLVECDYPYRFPVPAGQEWKGTSPLGDGWGFTCWLYDADYLAQSGLTAEEVLLTPPRGFASTPPLQREGSWLTPLRCGFLG